MSSLQKNLRVFLVKLFLVVLIPQVTIHMESAQRFRAFDEGPVGVFGTIISGEISMSVKKKKFFSVTYLKTC